MKTGKTDQRTKKATARENIQHRKPAEIAELFGTIDYDPKYDYKKQRRKS